MSLTKKQYAEERKKIAKDDREGKKIEKDMEKYLDKLVGSDLEKFQKDIVFLLKSIFTLEFQTRRHAKVVEAETGKTVGQVEAMFGATKEAILDLREKVAILRWFAVCDVVAEYGRKHVGNMPEKERVELLKTFGFDPEELKREWEAEHKAVMNA